MVFFVTNFLLWRDWRNKYAWPSVEKSLTKIKEVIISSQTFKSTIIVYSLYTIAYVRPNDWISHWESFIVILSAHWHFQMPRIIFLRIRWLSVMKISWGKWWSFRIVLLLFVKIKVLLSSDDRYAIDSNWSDQFFVHWFRFHRHSDLFIFVSRVRSILWSYLIYIYKLSLVLFFHLFVLFLS